MLSWVEEKQFLGRQDVTIHGDKANNINWWIQNFCNHLCVTDQPACLNAVALAAMSGEDQTFSVICYPGDTDYGVCQPSDCLESFGGGSGGGSGGGGSAKPANTPATSYAAEKSATPPSSGTNWYLWGGLGLVAIVVGWAVLGR